MRDTAALFCGVALACASCAGEATAATHVVVIDRMAYEPARLELITGDVVEWRNEDAVPHTATSLPGGFDVMLAPNEVKRSTIAARGTFDVTCRFHPGMAMQLEVRSARSEPES